MNCSCSSTLRTDMTAPKNPRVATSALDLTRHPRRRVIVGLDHLEQHARRVTDADELRAEAFLNLAVLDPVPREVAFQNGAVPLGTA